MLQAISTMSIDVVWRPTLGSQTPYTDDLCVQNIVQVVSDAFCLPDLLVTAYAESRFL